MRIAIDEARCSGHGRCWVEAPLLFDMDDTGRGVARTVDVPIDLEGSARHSAQCCPERAIVLDS